MAQSDPEDDEGTRQETLVNPNPLFATERLPGFEMQESRIERFHYRNGSVHNTIYEIWVKDPPAGSERHTFVKLELYVCKNRSVALRVAQDIYHATTEENQTPMVGKPRPGSYTGQPIGDYCWSYYNLLKPVGMPLPPRGPLNSSSSLVVVEKNNCFSILHTGSGDTGEGVSDRDTDRLAKFMVRRLKDWTLPP